MNIPDAPEPAPGPAVPAAVRAAVAGEALPALVVDLDAVDANLDDLLRRAGGTPIRVASKSLRIPGLIAHVLARPGFAGVLGYALPEALDLFRAGISADIVVAYPTADAAGLAELAADPAARAAITLMVDCVEHLDLLARHLGDPVALADAPVRICLDVDASWRPLPGVHVGTLRSPTRTPAQAAALARAVAAAPGLRLVGLMMYEGHIAGVGDRGSSARARGIRLMQRLSRRELARRRARVVAAVEAATGALEFVNGGGTGSLESTCAEAAVTEAAAGSGVVAPALFDGYRAFAPAPAEWFVLPVVRRPGPRTVTVAGGGRIASGPAGADRLPRPVWPEGLAYAPAEGPGEVQTPLTGAAAAQLALGDPVWFRHAKAGEAAEHANEAVVVAGGRVVDRWPTYRGEGRIHA